MRIRSRGVGLLAAAVILLSCDGELTDPAPYGRVRVAARTRTGEPLAGIAAVLYTGPRPMAYDTTDAAGRVDWTLVPEGRYGVLLTLPDSYATIGSLTGAKGGDVADGIPVAAGTDTTLVFTLLRDGAGRVEAQVLDEDGVALANMPVGLFTPRGVVAERRTDAAGHVTFRDVPLGNYGVFAVQPDSFGVPNRPWIVQDGLVIDRGYTASAALRMARCKGRIVVAVLDGSGAPLSGFSVRRVSAARVWPAVVTGADGVATLSPVICGVYGVYIEPRAGYSVPWAPDTAYVDSLVIAQGTSRAVTLRAVKLP